jgi:hypothetical protein
MEGDDDDVSGADIDTGTIPEGGWFEDGGTLLVGRRVSTCGPC